MSGEKKRNRPGRLPNYDYSSEGYYFVTFCTRNRDCCLSSIEKMDGETCVGRGALAPSRVVLKEPGRILEELIQNIPKVYPGIKADKYVIMPNHVHLLIHIGKEEDGNGDGGARAPRPTKAPHPTENSRPTVQMIVGGIKSLTRRKVGRPIWQTTFYDHIIRNEADYLRIWQYIDTNPAKWEEDEYYIQ